MKTNRLLILVCLAGLCALTALSAQEIGLDSTTSTGLAQRVDFNFNLGEQLALWWKVPLDANGSAFTGRGHLGVNLSVTGSQADGLLSGDLDSLVLSVVAPQPNAETARLQLDLGRLTVRDGTGLILGHAADGARMDVDFKAFSVDMLAAYTGLILRNASTIAASRYDEALAAKPQFGSTPFDAVEITGSRRLLAGVGLNFPDIFKQKLDISFLMQQDLNPADRLATEYQTSLAATGGPVNTQYTSLTLGGPIVDRLFYNFWFTYGSGSLLTWLADPASATGYSYRASTISSFLTGFKVDFFVPSFLGSAFAARCIVASGDADAGSATEGNTAELSTQFVPLTPASLGTVFSPKLSNLVFGELSASVKPIEAVRLQTGVKLMTFFRATTGAVGAAGIAPASASPYLGTEMDIFGTYRILSDLGVSLTGGMFFPGLDPVGAFSSTISPVQFALQLSLVLGM